MKARRQFDLVVLGAEPAGLAAAACAARHGAQIGARVAVVRTGEEAPPGLSTPGVPDFVWRRLDLQDLPLAVKPVDALVSVFDGEKPVATYANARRSAAALEASGADPFRLWADFTSRLERDWEKAEPLLRDGAKARPREARFLEALAAEGPALARRVSETCDETLDDYFDDAALKTHLAATALMPFGLAGDEPGSALALAAASDPAAWRLRPGEKSASLSAALEEACRQAGVEIIDSAIVSVERGEGRERIVLLQNGEALRAPAVMAATASSPVAARFGAEPALSPLARREGASAEVRVRLARPPAPPAGVDAKAGAVYFSAGSLDNLKAARDAALEGRLPDEPPIWFEIARDEIVARAPYVPAYLCTEDEPRDWSEQDRQLLGRLVVERLGKVFNGALEGVKRIDVKVAARGRDAAVGGARPAMLAPPAGHDEIGAAARLAMELVLGE